MLREGGTHALSGMSVEPRVQESRSDDRENVLKEISVHDNNDAEHLLPAIRGARIQVVFVPHHRWREGDYC